MLKFGSQEFDRLGNVLSAMNHYDLEAKHWICTSRDVDLVAANCQGNHEKFLPSQQLYTTYFLQQALQEPDPTMNNDGFDCMCPELSQIINV